MYFFPILQAKNAVRDISSNNTLSTPSLILSTLFQDLLCKRIAPEDTYHLVNPFQLLFVKKLPTFDQNWHYITRNGHLLSQLYFQNAIFRTPVSFTGLGMIKYLENTTIWTLNI